MNASRHLVSLDAEGEGLGLRKASWRTGGGWVKMKKDGKLWKAAGRLIYDKWWMEREGVGRLVKE